jgi:hypothetical protein
MSRGRGTKDKEVLELNMAVWLSDSGLRLSSLAARGLWIELLCHMRKGEKHGQLTINGRSMTTGEIAGLVGADIPKVETALAELEKNRVLTKLPDGTIVNRRMLREADQSTRLSQAREFAGKMGMAKRWGTAELPINPRVDAHKEIWTYWNSLGVMKHRTMTAQMESVIEKRLREFSTEEVKAAITNYAEILNSPEYWWNYRWTLKDFLTRGMDKFLDGEIAKNNYRNQTKGRSFAEKKPLQKEEDKTKELGLPG